MYWAVTYMLHVHCMATTATYVMRVREYFVFYFTVTIYIYLKMRPRTQFSTVNATERHAELHFIT